MPAVLPNKSLDDKKETKNKPAEKKQTKKSSKNK